MLYRYDEKTCLNGWWDIRFEYQEGFPEDNVPDEGFLEGKYLVPSFYNLPRDGVRFKGEPYFHPIDERSVRVAEADCEVLFDAFGYPREWSLAHSVWVRRQVDLGNIGTDKLFIVAEAAGPRARLYVNSHFVAEFRDYTLPFITDITDWVVDGLNELVLLLADYDYEDEEKRRTLWPSGGWTPHSMRGLWQDVYVLRRPPTHVQDVTIRTSFRQRTIALDCCVNNSQDKVFEGMLRAEVLGYPGMEPVLVIGEVPLQLLPGSLSSITIEKPWQNPKLWDANHPNLYWLRLTLVKAGRPIHTTHERFGFREVWLQEHNLMLNGHPLHLFSDWGHKTTPYQYTEGWVRMWFGMIKDFHMNHSRLHTNPHPRLVPELADELGIYLTVETALHGSACGQGAGTDSFWDHALEHVRRLVSRDKNHPSVLLWSCGNEMRWNTPNEASKKNFIQQMPKIQKLFQQLDSTREAYLEGDTSCFQEEDLKLLSRHYGRECTGVGWWKKDKPLISGEYGLFHLAGPNNTLQFGGDVVWEDQNLVNAFALEETVKLTCDARANGVAVMGPWNFSCLLNRRYHHHQHLAYDDYTTPGIKPLQVPAHTSEFRFWEKSGRGYDLAPRTEALQTLFRPFAALDLSYRTGFYSDQLFERELVFVNDTDQEVDGVYEVQIRQGELLKQVRGSFKVSRGHIEKIPIRMSLQGMDGDCKYSVRTSQAERILDDWSRTIYIRNRIPELKGIRLAVLGDQSLKLLLQSTGAEAVWLESVPLVADYPVLLIERGYVQPGTSLNQEILSFCCAGGRLVLLEQQHSLFPGFDIEEKSLLTTFIRQQHPLIQGIHPDELCYWGDSAYSLLSGDAYVAERFYRKDDGEWMNVILDSGEGNFGDGDLETVAMFTLPVGPGLIIASQCNITRKHETIPAARKLLINMVMQAVSYQPLQAKPVLEVHSACENLQQVLDRVFMGENALFIEPDQQTAQELSSRLKVPVRLHTEPEGTYQCVLYHSERLLDGLSNADLCGIDAYNYRSHEKNTLIAHQVIAPAKGIVPLALTAPQSCMRPFYVYGASTEMLRVPTASMYCGTGVEQAWLVAGMIPHGQGRVILSTFRSNPGEGERLKRFYRVLRRNLWANQHPVHPLSGEATRHGRDSSPGYPVEVFMRNEAVSQQTLQHMLTFCGYQIEHMNPKPLLDRYAFNKVPAPKGRVSAQVEKTDQPVLLYYTLESMLNRVREDNDLGLPNPMAETFLDLSGNGQVSVFINGQLRYDGQVSPNGITVSDLTILYGFNHILLLWYPTSTNDSLAMQWRDMARSPERGFRF